MTAVKSELYLFMPLKPYPGLTLSDNFIAVDFKDCKIQIEINITGNKYTRRIIEMFSITKYNLYPRTCTKI